MRYFVTVLFLLASQIIFAQVAFTPLQTNENKIPEIIRRVNPDQDPKLDAMISRHIEKNKKINGMDGYRVEIYFSSERDAREKALKKKVEFLSLYPDITVHVKYDAPNFRVRVGDFRTKNEALKLHRDIKSKYPVAFIVADKIDFPLLKYKPYERPN